MRWQALFDDLESQLDRELATDDLALDAEDERLRLARFGMRDRLVALGGQPVALQLVGGQRERARVADVGRDWVAIDAVGPPEWSGIVPLAAVASVSLPPEAVGPSLHGVAPEHPTLIDRLGVAFVLRDLCRRRRYVTIEGGVGMAGGTIDRVGRDHLDLAVHPPDVPRRQSAVGEVLIVPLDTIRLVRLR